MEGQCLDSVGYCGKRSLPMTQVTQPAGTITTHQNHQVGMDWPEVILSKTTELRIIHNSFSCGHDYSPN